MSESEKQQAYKLAEGLIAKARATNATTLSLSPEHDDDGTYLVSSARDTARKALSQLHTLPSAIADLPNLTRLYLNQTQVADIAPLANMTA
ncbi:MAG: hypothetical protein ACPG4X_21295, partial [Pikeienuella sp.]